MTNFEKISLMSKRELAEWLSQKVFKIYYLYEECMYEGEDDVLVNRIIKEVLEDKAEEYKE